MPATLPSPDPRPAASRGAGAGLAWLTYLLAMSACALLAPAVLKVDRPLAGAGPGGALILGALAVVGPARFSPWSAALWSALALMGSVARLAEAGPEPILGLAPETALVALLGLVYALAAGYVVACHLLDLKMKTVLLVLGAWSALAVPLALARGLTLWDLVQRKANPLAGTRANPYLDPTFVGVNAFLICVLAAGLFDLFSRLVHRDWRRGASTLVLVLTLFAGERYLLDRYDARGLPSFRTVVRDAVRAPADPRAR